MVALGYLAYDMAHKHSDSSDIIVGIGTGLSVLLTLGCVIGISLKRSRMNINMKVWSGVACIIVIVANFCFAGFGVIMPYYVIVISLLLVIHLWVVYRFVLE